MHTELVLHFLPSTKQKPDGKIKSKCDLRKHKDAIMWGAIVAGELLPIKLHSIAADFLGGYKKEYANAKKHRNVDEKGADLIPMSLYKVVS